MSKRRMVGWLPLAVENQTATKSEQSLPEPEELVVQTQNVPAPAAEPVATPQVGQPVAPAVEVAPVSENTGPIQDPNTPRRRMAGWEPLTRSHNVASVTPTVAATPSASPAESLETARKVETPGAPEVSAQPAAASVPAGAPVAAQDPDVPRRRMEGWQPLQVGYPAPAAEQASTPVEEPVTPAQEQAPAPDIGTAPEVEPVSQAAPAKPVRKRIGAAASAPGDGAQVKTPDVGTPTPHKEPAASQASEKPRKDTSRLGKVLITLGLVAIVAAGVVLLVQWVRSLDSVAEFIATYDGTPTHPAGVEAGIPAWVGWQHFFNFFIIVMVIRSGLFIRNQERPEAYWTPHKGGFFSPSTKNTPAKVSIQQWIHQSFNVLWVLNGLFFYVMVFATGHWMRIVPTNWDIFPNIVSAGVQYMSLDWPEENSWIYYNALQITTYFLTVFIAAPLAVLTGLRISTWWPQSAEHMNKAFPLPVARKMHFGTMIYFVAFILVHLFLVFTTGVLSNLNMMFTTRDAGDWWGIGVFALSVAVTVGIAWLMKPIFISSIAEKSGNVSSR